MLSKYHAFHALLYRMTAETFTSEFCLISSEKTRKFIVLSIMSLTEVSGNLCFDMSYNAKLAHCILTSDEDVDTPQSLKKISLSLAS